MNKRVILIFSIVIACSALIVMQLSRFAVDTSLRNWYSGAPGFYQAIAQQHQSGKPIAIFFYADWCAACKKLKQDILATEEFIHYQDNLIAVKVNPELGAAEQSIAKKFAVLGFPTFVILPANSNQYKYIHKTSHITTQEFINACNNAVGI